MVKACDVCARNKTEKVASSGLLQPLPIPQQAWTDNSMDFVGVPKSKGKDVILVVVDRLAKYGHFLALVHPFSAKDMGKLFLQQVYRLHVVPVRIVTD